MYPKSPRSHVRLYLYLLVVAVCMVGLPQAATMTSSSYSPNGNAENSAKQQAKQKLSTELFGGSYSNSNSTLWREINQRLQDPAAKISAQVLSETADGGSTSVVILLADQADVRAAHAMKDHDARGWFVYHTLTQHAARTQVGLQQFLKSRDIDYQSFWAANMLVANADRSLIMELAAR